MGGSGSENTEGEQKEKLAKDSTRSTVHCKRKIVDESGSSGHPKEMPMKMGMTDRMDDPDYPKRPPNGFGLFFSEQTSQHADRDGDITKMVFNLWNNLTRSEKDVYLEKGRLARERYDADVALYKEKAAKDSSKSLEGGGKTRAALSEPQKKKPRKMWITKMDDPDYPKGPRNAYNIFFSEQASQHSNKDGDIRTNLAQLWKSMSDTEKAVYKAKADQEKETYQTVVAVYEEMKAKESSKSTEGGGKTSEGDNVLVEVPNEGMGKGDVKMGEASNNPVEGESDNVLVEVPNEGMGKGDVKMGEASNNPVEGESSG